MPLITGSPVGTITYQDDIRPEGAPNLFIQLYEAAELNRPDSDGFYWGLSATVAYPVIALGCVEAVSLTENLTENDVTCDNTGVTDTIARRNFIELNMTLKTFFPLAQMKVMLKTGTVTTNAGQHTEKVGLGSINNNQFLHCYGVNIYDEDFGDYIAFTLHKCKFVNAWTIDFRYGQSWQITGLKCRAYADSTMPAAQKFATIIRADASKL